MNDHSSYSPSSHVTGREEVEKTGTAAEPRKMTEMGKSVFKIRFYFLRSYSDLMSDKFNNFPKSSLFCPCW